mgnify:CR=1 FL=1
MAKILNILLILKVSTTLLYIESANTAEPLRIPLHASHISLDPTAVQDLSALWVSRQVNCQLVRSQGSTLVFEAAETVHFETPLKIKIKLKDTNRFHDGSRVTAQDVAATFNHLKTSRTILRNIFLWIRAIEVIGTNELVLTLSKPIPQFLKVLSAPNYALFKKSFLERNCSA